MRETDDTFVQVVRSDPIVAYYAADGSLSTPEGMRRCIADLSGERLKANKEILRKDAILPRLYRLPDGRTLRWDAPDRDVPLTLLKGEPR